MVSPRNTTISLNRHSAVRAATAENVSISPPRPFKVLLFCGRTMTPRTFKPLRSLSPPSPHPSSCHYPFSSIVGQKKYPLTEGRDGNRFFRATTSRVLLENTTHRFIHSFRRRKACGDYRKRVPLIHNRKRVGVECGNPLKRVSQRDGRTDALLTALSFNFTVPTIEL